MDFSELKYAVCFLLNLFKVNIYTQKYRAYIIFFVYYQIWKGLQSFNSSSQKFTIKLQWRMLYDRIIINKIAK